MNQTHIKSQTFDEEKLSDYIKTFSFPRLAGSIGERKSVKLTNDIFKNIGFDDKDIIKQEFKFSTFYSKILIKIIIAMNIIAISLLLIVRYLYPFLVFLISMFLLIGFFSIIKVFKHPELRGFWERHLGKIISATNVFTKVPSLSSYNNAKIQGNIIVSAHLDSKSQTYKTIWRIILFRIWLYGEILLIISYIAFIIDQHSEFESIIIGILALEILIIISSASVIISNIFLLFLNIRNKSPGALDNASGMSIVFELSNYFIKKPLRNFNLWFCQFSAEEIGTMGSRNFIDAYSDQFEKGKTFQINFDMVSASNNRKNEIEYIKSYGLFPRKKISPILFQLIEKSSRKENIKVGNFHVSIGAHTDSVPFHLRKFDSVDFTTRAAAKYTHSEDDVPIRVDPSVLIQTCILTRRLILSLDNEIDF